MKLQQLLAVWTVLAVILPTLAPEVHDVSWQWYSDVHTWHPIFAVWKLNSRTGSILPHRGVGNERNLVHLMEKSVEIKLKS